MSPHEKSSVPRVRCHLSPATGLLGDIRPTALSPQTLVSSSAMKKEIAGLALLAFPV